ncbi:CYTH domain-containing protein [Halovulum sp. GXIMD14794]
MATEIEIERKFLVRQMPDLSNARSEAVRQGYLTLPEDSVELRLRQKGARFFLTLKSGDGLARQEREVPIDAAQFDRLWPATEGRRIEKERWTGGLPGGLVFELDVFAGAHAPLRLVEVEFPSEDAARSFTPPDWLGTEVTSDKRYGNKVMALRGLPAD